MSTDRKPATVLRAADIEAHSVDFVHPWHPTSAIRGAFLAGPAGLTRCGVNLIALRPKNQSFTYHAHLLEEEWIYLLAGRAVLVSGDTRHELVAGDFAAFPAPQAPHQLHNESDEDVVYLSGGERPPTDIVDFPELGKRLVRVDDRATVYDLATGTSWPFLGKPL
jgi:uncharacterized cupin superfamily protein